MTCLAHKKISNIFTSVVSSGEFHIGFYFTKGALQSSYELNDEYIKCMEDVLDVYARPYDEKNPVVCFDEKPVPLISNTREPTLPTGPGEVLKKDYEYKRDGSANVFCFVEPKTGRYFNKVTWQRCNGDFAECMKDLASAYPDVEKIVLVMDNLSTHTEKAVISKFGEKVGKDCRLSWATRQFSLPLTCTAISKLATCGRPAHTTASFRGTLHNR